MSALMATIGPGDANGVAAAGAGGGDPIEGGEAGFVQAEGAVPDAAWYLAEDGAPPLHYNMLVAMKGTRHSIRARSER